MATVPSPVSATSSPRTANGRSTVDGRTVRGERTRRALAEALLSLLEEGDVRPTARQVADRAGVSLRLVFHHFDDMEAVLRSAVAVQVERHWKRLEPIDPTLPLAERVARLVRQRAGLFEAIAPVRRAAALVEGDSPTVGSELDHARRELRAQLADVFQPELDAAGAQRSHLLDMLELSSSFESWDQLRRRIGRSAGAARRVMTDLLLSVLVPSPRSGGTS
jgi:AcrR family transcriptional regulator